MPVDISKTILMKLNFTGLGNSAKVSTAQVECDTDKDLLRVSKKLLDSPELEAIRSLDGEIRRYVYDTCLPFEAGIHLLPTALIEMVEARLADYRSQRDQLVSLFVSAYPRLCEDAARRLRGGRRRRRRGAETVAAGPLCRRRVPRASRAPLSLPVPVPPL